MNLDLIGIVAFIVIPALSLFSTGNKVSLLVGDRSFKILLVICIALAIVGFSTIGYINKNTVPNNLYLGLICPLYGLIIHRLMLIGFRKMYGRNPVDYGKDAITNANKADKLFQGIFLLLAFLGPVALVGICS